MGVNGKSKGNTWERQFCKILSHWWTRGEDADVFWRTASSGAKATITGNLKDQLGDVTFIKETGRPLIDLFCLELKHYGSVDLYALLKPQFRQLLEWWDKVKEEASEFDKIPFVVFKVTRNGVFGMLPNCWHEVLDEARLDYFVYKDAVIFNFTEWLWSECVYQYVGTLLGESN